MRFLRQTLSDIYLAWEVYYIRLFNRACGR